MKQGFVSDQRFKKEKEFFVWNLSESFKNQTKLSESLV